MDPEPVFSPGHDPMPKDLVARREGTRRISPEEIYSTVVKHKLDTVTKFFAFAARQLAAAGLVVPHQRPVMHPSV